MLHHILKCVIIQTNFVFGFTLEPVKLGIILPSDSKFPFSISRVKPGIDIAIEFVKTSQILPNHEIQTYVRDSNCSEIYGPLRAIDLYMKKEAHVFIGPFCVYAMAPIARFAPSWSIPVITAGAHVKAFDDKSLYKTLTRIHYTYEKNAGFLWEITRVFNWSTIGLLYSDSKQPDGGKSNYFFAMEPIFSMFKSRGYKVNHKSFKERYFTYVNYEEILVKMSKQARGKLT